MEDSKEQNRLQRLLNRKKRQQEGDSDQSEQTQPEGRKIPTAVKFVGVGVALVALPPVLGMFGGLLDFSSKTETQQVSTVQPAANTPESTPQTDNGEANREAWNRVMVAKASLTDNLSKVDAQILASRSQQWWLFARQECAKQGPSKCQSPYSFLSDRYLIEAAKLQRIGISGKFSTAAQPTADYIRQRWVVSELSEALSSVPSGSDVPVNWVASGELTASIDELMRKARDFESLRLSKGEQSNETQR